MNICRFNGDRLGLVEGPNVFDVTAALRDLPAPAWPYPPGDPLIRHLDAIRTAIAAVRPRAPAVPLNSVTLNSPVTSPTKVMAAPANYALHVSIDAQDPGVNHGLHNKQLEGVDRPVDKLGLFLKASSSIVGPGEGIALNWLDRRNDHEVEVAVVIGKGGRDIPRQRAFAHIAGYMIGLDMTVRGTEDRSWRKSADSYTVFGPWLTTADAIEDPEKLTIWLDVNGEPRQKSSTGAMTVGIAELIEMCSHIYELHPGDVLMTGTPEGVSAVKPGDVITAGCTGLGEMQVAVRGKG
ncbi:fumarylacetoacetate hydrolase family protein [Roseiarcaceae bacterium H3SJ34-1]|uniref:fumarylacetoacetate hydrolase family protein n=1 Tax=Terripilifer ovatus TaxID=3032367 RepID=UPI003AB94334|nr:fumarylacetoacetate hydrolase family protein [Roseiarcaceae bacterium H3SJ34-1]